VSTPGVNCKVYQMGKPQIAARTIRYWPRHRCYGMVRPAGRKPEAWPTRIWKTGRTFRSSWPEKMSKDH